MELRYDIGRLIKELVYMVSGKQAERPFSLPLSFATSAVPQFFEYPRLRLIDEESGSVAYWSNPSRTSQFVQCRIRNSRIEIEGVPDDTAIDLRSVMHPITNSEVTFGNPLDALELRPTPRLHAILMDAFTFMVGEKPELKRLKALPFTISAGAIRLNLDLALNVPSGAGLGVEISPAEVDDFSTILTYPVPNKERPWIKTQLHQLGEKCARMSDANCAACLNDKQYLCLRSLAARYFRHHMLLSHKGIELCDLQGELSIEGDVVPIFAFSKLARGSATLTLRNDAGAALFSQISSQIDKVTFRVVLVLTPSVISEDLRERVRFIAGLVGKRVLFVDFDLLSKMLLHFQEQMEFDEKDPSAMYRASAKKDKVGNKTKGLNDPLEND